MSTRPTERAVGAGGGARLDALRDAGGRAAGKLALVAGRGADVLALVRGRGELVGAAGAAAELTGEVVGVTAIAAAGCSAAGRAEQPLTASSSATAHPILITGTSLPPTHRPAIRRAVARRLCQTPGLACSPWTGRSNFSSSR
jgi:hypothetical protein